VQTVTTVYGFLFTRWTIFAITGMIQAQTKQCILCHPTNFKKQTGTKKQSQITEKSQF